MFSFFFQVCVGWEFQSVPEQMLVEKAEAVST